MKQLRIVGLGDYADYYSYFLYGIMEGSLLTGHIFRPVRLMDTTLSLIERQVDFMKPDIILCHCIFNKHFRGSDFGREEIFNLLKKFKERYGTYIFYHMGDGRVDPRFPYPINDIVDAGLVNNNLIDHFQSKWKIPCFNWPYACLHQLEIADKEERFNHDLVFTGGLGAETDHYHGERSKFIKDLNIEIKVYPDEELGNSRFFTSQISSSAKSILGFQMADNVPGYLDVRPYQYIGAGALYFHNESENMRKVFTPKVHYVEFTDMEDFVEKYEYYTKTEKGDFEASIIRIEGFNYCQKHHGYINRLEKVVKIYEKKPVFKENI